MLKKNYSCFFWEPIQNIWTKNLVHINLRQVAYVNATADWTIK